MFTASRSAFEMIDSDLKMSVVARLSPCAPHPLSFSKMMLMPSSDAWRCVGCTTMADYVSRDLSLLLQEAAEHIGNVIMFGVLLGGRRHNYWAVVTIVAYAALRASAIRTKGKRKGKERKRKIMYLIMC